MDGFAELIDASNAFFAELAQNNNKAWFEPRKAHYITDIKKPAELLADLMAEDLNRLTGKAHKPKLFRIYRDVRFSKDKTPYNAHLHLVWTPISEGGPAWFFGSAPDYLIMGLGLMSMNGGALTRYRAFVDRDGGALSDAIANTPTATISDWGPEPLKRVPKPYDADHPQGDLLKRKALAVTMPLANGWRTDGLVPAIHGAVTAMLPIWNLIDAEFS